MIINGKELAAKLNAELAARMPSLVDKYGRAPHLAVILIGDNPASHTYVRNKAKVAESVGIKSTTIEKPGDISEEELISIIDQLNCDGSVDGILVQLPLPKHICEKKIIERISFEKDVDGFHPRNIASLWLNEKCIVPCTPKGIMELIDTTGIDIAGKKAVVVGRSDIVGKPVAKLLLDRNATVTIAHSKTEDLASVTREADIIVAAAGRPGLITGDMVKTGATIIDVGINHVPATDAQGSKPYRITGDVDFESASQKAAYITPVPGGVGPMTLAMLMQNTIECFELRLSK